MRVAVNVEQLLHEAPGGIGRYTAELVRLLPAQGVDVTAFTARHAARRRRRGRCARTTSTGVDPVVLPLPAAALLYDAWHVLGRRRSGAARRAGRPRARAVTGGTPDGSGAARRHRARRRTARDARGLHPSGRHVPPAGLRGGGEAGAAGDRGVGVQRRRDRDAHRDPTRSDPRRPQRCRPRTGDPGGRRTRRARRSGSTTVRTCSGSGTFQPRKNVRVLLDAFAALDGRDVPHRLVLAGPPGWKPDDADAVAAARARRPRAAARARSTVRSVFPLFAGADLFAFPSRHEGFGIPVRRGDGAGHRGGVLRHPGVPRGGRRRRALRRPRRRRRAGSTRSRTLLDRRRASTGARLVAARERCAASIAATRGTAARPATTARGATQGGAQRVRTSTPVSVTSTVCSNCAVREPSDGDRGPAVGPDHRLRCCPS